MSNLRDSLSEGSVEASKPSTSADQPFRTKSSLTNMMKQNPGSSSKQSPKKKQSSTSRQRKVQDERKVVGRTFTNSTVDGITTQCDNVNIDSDSANEATQNNGAKRKNAKKKEKKKLQLQMPQMAPSPNIVQPSPPVSVQQEISYAQELFLNQISPLYANRSTRYLENVVHHPHYQYMCAQMLHSQTQFASMSIPNTPMGHQEPKSPQYLQNAMQHPLLCKSFSVGSEPATKHQASPSFAPSQIHPFAMLLGQLAGPGFPKPDDTPKRRRPRQKKDKPQSDENKFEPYLTPEQVEEGLKNNTLIEGALRINPKQFQHSYVSSTDRSEQDVLIEGIKHRNRALESDIVVVQLLDEETESEDQNDNIKNVKNKKRGNKEKQAKHLETTNEVKDEEQKNKETKIESNESVENKPEGNVSIENKSGEGKSEENKKENNQKKGKVVYIKERVHNRTCIGQLKLMPDRNRQKALFVPRDHRVPRLNIPCTSWPDNFYQDAKKYENTLFLARILNWSDTRFAVGTIACLIGQSGDMMTESKAILAQNDLDITPFSSEVRDLYPRLDYTIPEEEIKLREDCRCLCLFSIDPYNCRDIDDAVSCRELDNGNYEIGVHISDVAHFLTENTVLDEKVSEKATTIYMVEKAYHMLPDELCMLCSLFPGVDKLAFSVFWEITKDAKVLSHRFAKTVIHSCCQLAYEHAQAVLDGKANAEDEFPEIYNGFKYEDVYKVIKTLGNISANFRRNRFEGGALRIDQPKVSFHLNASNGLPDSFWIYESKESHQLIEEFMLLANMTVATRIYEDHPTLAFLRCHPPPSGYMLKQLAKSLKPLGIDLDIDSAGDLHRSLLPFVGPEADRGRAMVLNMLCAKPMTRAKYFCAGAGMDDDDFKHYALNVPLYTHFTSPIRRYADIMVHRLLAASLNYREVPKWEVDRVRGIAAQCNKQKYNAKKAGEMSTELYTLKYIELHSPMVTEAVVVEVREKYIDVIIVAVGLNRRIYFNSDFPGEHRCIKNDSGAKLSKMEVNWKATKTEPAVTQVIDVFSILQVEMHKGDEMVKVETKLVRPTSSDSAGQLL